MKEQVILSAHQHYEDLDRYLKNTAVKKVLLVCGNSIRNFKINTYFNSLMTRTGIEVIRFTDFKPNPQYESIVNGIQVFKYNHCDAIIAVGGGSAMDVAKCIKLFQNMNSCKNYLAQKIVLNTIPLIAVPTTAGTGSEATRFAVIYYEGIKQSISDYSSIPAAVVIDPSTLESLPEYYRKSSMLDAFCHAIESFWSVNSTSESRQYSRDAIMMIMENMDGYLANNSTENAKMLKASNLAGKAINITQTTAGHAMCYKMTSLYGIAHGHAAALCVEKLWPYMQENLDKCIDPRGKAYLADTLASISTAMECDNTHKAVNKYSTILRSLALDRPQVNDNDFILLKNSVNLERLKNHPVQLDEEIIDKLYHQILVQ